VPGSRLTVQDRPLSSPNDPIAPDVADLLATIEHRIGTPQFGAPRDPSSEGTPTVTPRPIRQAAADFEPAVRQYG
jgi:hypothetical protein